MFEFELGRSLEGGEGKWSEEGWEEGRGGVRHCSVLDWEEGQGLPEVKTRSEWLLRLLLGSLVGGLICLVRRWRRNRRRAMVTPQTNSVPGRASSRDILSSL